MKLTNQKVRDHKP